jgi:intracellular sulfur oxidation DsrE/DsrF family protein
VNEKRPECSIARRGFLTQLGAGVGLAGASVVSSPAAIKVAVADRPWQPARHSQDDWFDKVPGEHRFVLDTTTPDGLVLALQFATSYFAANQTAYGLKNSDLAVVIVARHRSTPFAYANSIWARYGRELSQEAGFSDPKIDQPLWNDVDLLLDHLFTRTSVQNIFAAPGDRSGTSQMTALIDNGMRFAVCEIATRSICGKIAHVMHCQPESVFTDIEANLVPNARMVSAGVVALNRAQERGYSYVYAG